MPVRRPSPRVLASLPLVTLLVCACADSTPSATPPAERVSQVETVTAAVEDVEVVLEAVGIVEASEEAEIRPQVDGTVAEVLYREGARVARDELLVRLDDAKPVAKRDLARAALDSAKARLRLAEQRLHRGRQLIAQDLISREAFDQLESEQLAATAAVREQAAAVTLADRELDDYHIRAPFDGRVGARLIDVGNYVQEGDELVVLMKTDPVEVEFKVPDQNAERLRTGIPVRVTPPPSKTTLEGAISFVNPRVDPNTRMLDLKARVANPDDLLLDGQFVEVSLLLDVRKAQVVIPEEAVVTLDGNLAVYVVEDDVARQRAVTLGMRMPPRIEVLSGIAAGEVLVIGGQHRLHDGARVALAGVAEDGGTGR